MASLLHFRLDGGADRVKQSKRERGALPPDFVPANGINCVGGWNHRTPLPPFSGAPHSLHYQLGKGWTLYTLCATGFLFIYGKWLVEASITECRFFFLCVWWLLLLLLLQISCKRSRSFKIAVHCDQESCDTWSDTDLRGYGSQRRRRRQRSWQRRGTLFNRMVRRITKEYLVDERDRLYYADNYTCCPPPLFIPAVSLIEVSTLIFISYSVWPLLRGVWLCPIMQETKLINFSHITSPVAIWMSEGPVMLLRVQYSDCKIHAASFINYMDLCLLQLPHYKELVLFSPNKSNQSCCTTYLF